MLALPALVIPTASCRSAGQGRSIWPPPDFRLDARAYTVDDRGVHYQQNFRVWSGGLVVYRESRGDLEDAPFPLPVYSRIAAYQLDPRSTRMLARLLQRAGLFGQEGYVETAPDDRGRNVQLTWTAFGRSGSLSTLSAEIDTLERATHVVNAFLPEGHNMSWPGELVGERQPQRVEEAPQPADDLDGAVAVHEALARRFPEDPDLLLELFAAAVAAGQREPAEAALRTLESLEPPDQIPAEPGDAPWLEDVIAPLRPLLPPEATDDSR